MFAIIYLRSTCGVVRRHRHSPALAMVLVRPATVVEWHRRGFRFYWCWRSRRLGRPRINLEIRDLIRRMSKANPLWAGKREIPGGPSKEVDAYIASAPTEAQGKLKELRATIKQVTRCPAIPTMDGSYGLLRGRVISAYTCARRSLPSMRANSRRIRLRNQRSNFRSTRNCPCISSRSW
jgi:hypothetical protein